MDQIYRNASHVSIWLGLAPLPDQEVFTISEDQIEHIRTFDVEPHTWADHVKELANRLYWSRYWVIQECLCARDIQIHCSGNIAHWEDFRDTLGRETYMNLLKAEFEVSLLPEGVELELTLHGALPLLLARQPVHDPLQTRPLHELLVHYRHSQCTDPRDRVFALLGLLELSERKLLERFFPNYSLSEDRVIIITLAHLRDMSLIDVTVESEELFYGLGVESKARRARLLWAAEKVSTIVDLNEVENLPEPERVAALLAIEDDIDTSEYESYGKFQAAQLQGETSEDCCIL
jgi:hypothetical protein